MALFTSVSQVTESIAIHEKEPIIHATTESIHETDVKTEGVEVAHSDWPNNVGFDMQPEVKEPVELRVIGEIPDYVRGVLYRVGPGGYTVPLPNGETFTMKHWFDGFSQTHRFEIIDGKRVTYRSRFTCDGLIEGIRKAGKFDGYSFGQSHDPCQTIFRKFMGVFEPSKLVRTLQSSAADSRSISNCGVTIETNHAGLSSGQTGKGHGGVRTLHTKTDANVVQEHDPETLEPIGIATQKVLHPELDGPLSASHGCHDPETGDFFNYNLKSGRESVYRIFKVSGTTGKTSVLATIRDAQPCYIHSSFLSAKYHILCVWPAVHAWYGAKILLEKNVLTGLEAWNPKAKARFYVTDRHGDKGVVRVFEHDAFFAFHAINAYEDGDDLILDVPTYQNTDILHKMYVKVLIDGTAESKSWSGKARPTLTRFRLKDITTGDAKEVGKAEVVFDKDISFELPTINNSYATKPYRYIYAVIDRCKTTFMDGIVKYDTKTHESKIWEHHAHTPGEAIFVANPEGIEEDDGVLLTVVLDGPGAKSYLLILDAKDMKEIARAEMDSVVPLGFHGTHHPKTS